MKRFQFLVRIDKDPRSDWGASVPDLPGCVATSRTIDGALGRIRRAIELHVESLSEDGSKPPRPRRRSVVPRASKGCVQLYAAVEVWARVA